MINLLCRHRLPDRIGVFAVVVSKVMGLPDPHSYGSGNPGATNVLRTGNKKAAISR
jgi:glycerol-3-phosphate acyltransferase PlsY